jgi:hypothetical protein
LTTYFQGFKSKNEKKTPSAATLGVFALAINHERTLSFAYG